MAETRLQFLSFALPLPFLYLLFPKKIWSEKLYIRQGRAKAGAYTLRSRKVECQSLSRLRGVHMEMSDSSAPQGTDWSHPGALTGPGLGSSFHFLNALALFCLRTLGKVPSLSGVCNTQLLTRLNSYLFFRSQLKSHFLRQTFLTAPLPLSPLSHIPI